MNTMQFYESNEYQKAARNLFTEVSRLIDEAKRTGDPHQQRRIYLKAMSISAEAYNLLGKAREFAPDKRADVKKPAKRRLNSVAVRG